MKLPNSYGSVYKLSGKRRNPWAARKTVGWKQIPEKKKAYPVYKFIGYYPSRSEALQALAEYNSDPYDLNIKEMTFSDVYEKWSEEHFQYIKRTAPYTAAYAVCKPLYDMRFADIKLDHLQKVVDESGKNKPTLKTVKTLWSLLWDFAVIHEIVPPDKKGMIKYVNISKAGNPNRRVRKPFTREDIQKLWDSVDADEYISVILMLIYSGCRISELLNLKCSDVHLDEKYFYIRQAKTAAGVREVPIADKTVPFFKQWMDKGNEYLIVSQNNKHVGYWDYFNLYWISAISEAGLEDYTPHCTRHTCISLLTEAGVDERIIQQIVGHKGQNVTQAVYTHIDLPAKLEAINRI